MPTTQFESEPEPDPDEIKPTHLPHEAEPEPEYPPRNYLVNASVGEEFLLQEAEGKAYRAVVVQVEPWVVVVLCRTTTALPVPRAFAVNGFELGAYPGAELKIMPADRRQFLQQRELLLELRGLMDEHGENVLPADELQNTVYAAKRFARFRADEVARQVAELEILYRRPQPTTFPVRYKRGTLFTDKSNR